MIPVPRRRDKLGKQSLNVSVISQVRTLHNIYHPGAPSADEPANVLSTSASQERSRTWAGLPHEIREWFSGPPTSQVPKSPPEAFTHDVPGPNDLPAESFVLGLISASSVDYLDLQQGKRQLFTKLHADDTWSMTDTCA